MRPETLYREETHEPAHVPMSYAQQRLWLLDRIMPASTQYNFPVALRLRGPLDRAALERAVNAIVSRHEILRTRFVSDETGPVQVVQSARWVPLVLEDVAATRPLAPEQHIHAALDEEWRAPFDIAAGPILRTRLLRVSDDDHVFIRTCHHIAFDASSNRRFDRELAALYNAYRAGRDNPLDPLRAQYADFARWQRSAVDEPRLADGVKYWTARLADVSASGSLPPDRPRPSAPTFEACELRQPLSAAEWTALTGLARAERATPFMVLLAAFAFVVARHTGSVDVTIGTPMTDRGRPEFEPLVGLFVNLLILRLRLAPQMTARAFIAQARDVALGGYRHGRVPFERVVQELSLPRTPGHAPLVQTMLVFQDAAAAVAPFDELHVEVVDADEAMARFELVLYAIEHEAGLQLRWCYSRELFDRHRVEQLSTELRAVLSAMVRDPAVPLARLHALPATASAQIASWNATDSAIPSAPLPELIRLQVRRTPDATALVFDDSHVTYAALEALSTNWAAKLHARHVGPGCVVAIAMERSIDAVVAILAAHKAGAAYLPLDPEYPAQRLATMADRAKPALIVTSAARPVDVASAAATMTLDSRSDPSGSAFEQWLDRARADAPAYVMCTSGSTGMPKPVVVTHRSVVNLLQWLQSRFTLAADDRVLHKTPLGFDVSVWELFWPLVTGAAIVVARGGGHKDPHYLTELIQREQATTLHFVPSLLGAIVDHPRLARCHSLRRVLTGGEPLPVRLAQRFHERVPAALFHLYGPTEATVDATCWAQTSECDGPRVPIGQPIANTRLHVLDVGLAPSPIGVAGELYIAGAGVALGYLGQPAATATHFVATHDGRPGARMYRTGDRVRWRSDGSLEFLGRSDNQVKVRGNRIEPEEIEAALATCSGVASAVVVAQSAGDREARLVAYVAPRPGSAPDASALRLQLRQQLPDYMLPDVITTIPSIPLTAHGKVDRRALPPVATGPRDTGGAEPVTPEQRVLCRVFAEELGLERVGIDAHFFEIGGHSLAAIRVVTRLKTELGLDLSIRTLFERPTVATLAAALSTHTASDAFARCLPLRSAGDRPPLLCLPPAAGLGWTYSGLLRGLDPARPVYCLQAVGIADDSALPASIEAAAADYVALVRAIQPHGPYHLLGWSFGGVVGHEVACRLRDAGDEVALLAILDGYPADPHMTAHDAPDADSEHVVEIAARLRSMSRLMPKHTERIHVHVAHARMLRQRFVPRRFDGELLLFASAGAVTPREAWSPFADSVVVRQCECDHHSMTDAAVIHGIAERLEAYLRPSDAPEVTVSEAGASV